MYPESAKFYYTNAKNDSETLQQIVHESLRDLRKAIEMDRICLKFHVDFSNKEVIQSLRKNILECLENYIETKKREAEKFGDLIKEQTPSYKW